MKNKNLIASFSIITILLLALSACGTEPAPAVESPSENLPANSANMHEEEPATESESEPEPAPTEEPQPEEQAEPAAPVSYSADIEPLWESRCTKCHGGERIEGDFVLNSYADLMAGGESGPVIVPGDADNSYLAQLLLDQKMPKRGPKLTPPQVEIVISWINQGAEEN